MKKILVGFIMDGNGGGVDNYLLNFLNNISGEDVQVDFLTNKICSELQKKLQQYHSRIFEIANLKHPIKQYQQACNIIRRDRYDVVYLNVSTAIDCITALAAKRCNVKRIMIHSHSSGNDCENTLKRITFNLIHQVCRTFLYKTASEYYGCSKKAGIWMFPRKIVESNQFHTIFNAVDLEKYAYDSGIRTEVRKELNLEGKFVVGHVGNFSYTKNHYFLIRIFEELKKKCPEAVLVLVGNGVRFENVKKLVKEKGLEDSVRILGFRKDVDRLFQAIDFFLLPSYFEGLPTVSIEAQCTGLPCLMSENVTSEAAITETCWFLSLKANPEKWADFILAHRDVNRTEIRWQGETANYSLEVLKKQQIQLIKG